MKRKASRQLTPRPAPKRKGAPSHTKLQIINNPAMPDVKTAFIRITNSAVSLTGIVADVFGGMTQGVLMRNQFLGRRFNPIGVDMRYTVTGPNGNMVTATRFDSRCRVSLIQWGDVYVVNTPPAPTGIYEDSTCPESGFELVNWENINVLHDNLIPVWGVMAISATNQTSNSVCVHKYIKKHKLDPVLYSDASNAWQKGGLVFSYYCESSVAPLPVLNAWIRVYFTDA